MQEMIRDPYAYYNFYNAANNFRALEDLILNLVMIALTVAVVAIITSMMFKGNGQNSEIEPDPEEQRTPAEKLSGDELFLKSLRISIEKRGAAPDEHFRKVLSGEIAAKEYRYLQLTRAGH